MESRALLDQFWAAVIFEHGESIDDSHIDRRNNHGAYHHDKGRIAEDNLKRRSTPMIDITPYWNDEPQTSSDQLAGVCSDVDSCPNSIYCPHNQPYRPDHSDVPSELLTISGSALGASSRPMWSSRPTTSHLRPQTSRRPSPSPSTLALVSTFLNEIVNLGHSRTSTPCTMMTVSEESDVRIVESEVFVNVIEDGRRAGLCGPLELQQDNTLELEIPPVSSIRSLADTHDMPSPCIIDGPAGCAQELDALSWMSWERQLSNLHDSFSH